ncbi:glycosyl transferase family 17 protein [Moniliophthora roreri MCA 2997]|uniref:Glycosyl transferase family 17 protein n=2 Tax=Moniliophthora roreri TaxID=221103 RepID=V2WDI9_MONRO|nr:glycosyl transferase family 17 protein [Moniliophthora roreri MCA 2997]KAI3616604.1 glycosyl transferase family 17 protein [Moniliophthora roreri]
MKHYSARVSRRRSITLILPLLFLASLSLFYIHNNLYQLRNLLSYSTRPIWDSADGPTEIIPHYYAEGLADAYTCQLHGWKRRENPQNVKVLDAVLMSSELDLLELRLNELDGVVDQFFIIESNTTFTGLPKETYYDSHKGRFEKFESKILYQFLPGQLQTADHDAWKVEAETRTAMSSFLRGYTKTLPSDTTFIVIMSDLDELPSAHTIKLLRDCDFGETIHLQLRNYLYSFEWLLGLNSWRASVVKWNAGGYYSHIKRSEQALADSGWHCSYCFRALSEFVTKMQGFSHSDRIGGNMDLLKSEKIQEKICRGDDIFGMLPEAYSYLDLFYQMNLQPQKSMVGLPKYLLENAQHFKFLLPGGCQRDAPSDTVS